MRKFVLLIHIEGAGFLALGKTCRFCTPCELIICHQDELEDELFGIFEQRKPQVIGNPYLVFGTVDKQWWKMGLAGDTRTSDLEEYFQHVAQFKQVLDLKLGGGWQPPRDTPKRGKPKGN